MKITPLRVWLGKDINQHLIYLLTYLLTYPFIFDITDRGVGKYPIGGKKKASDLICQNAVGMDIWHGIARNR